jgi:hypothetical protein
MPGPGFALVHFAHTSYGGHRQAALLDDKHPMKSTDFAKRLRTIRSLSVGGVLSSFMIGLLISFLT